MGWWYIETAKKRLINTPYEKYNVVSKYDYAGVFAEIVIDNVSEQKFIIQSNIKPKYLSEFNLF